MIGFRAKVEAWSNPVVKPPQPPPVLPGDQPQLPCFSSSGPVWAPHSYRLLQKGGPLLPSLPTVPVTSAQTSFFIITYRTTLSPTPQEHTCKHLLPVRTGLVVGDVILRNSRCGSISRTQVFLQMNSLNQGLMLLICGT